MKKLLSALERLIALTAGLFLLPFLLAIAAATAILSKSAPLVAHRRVGRNGVL